MDDKMKKHVGHRLRMLNNGIDKFFASHKPEKAEIRLTHAQCAVMHYLYDHRDTQVFQKDLETFFQISGATASNTLKGMEKVGVIERIPLAEDGRKKQLSLTETGTHIHESALAHMQNMEDTLTAGMSQEEIELFINLLERATQNMENAAEEHNLKK